MPTYVYETIPAKAGGKPRHFEIRQRMNDAPLEKHPETGEAIRRVVMGGLGVISGSKGGESPAPRGGCGSGCGCHS